MRSLLSVVAFSCLLTSFAICENPCGPPSYACAASSQEVMQLPKPMPAMGDPLHGVNAHWTDGGIFPGAEYIRVTDAGDDNPGSFGSFSMGDSGETSWVNADSTLFLVARAGGGYVIKTWDKVNKLAGRTPLVFRHEIAFDPQNPNLIWERAGTQIYQNLITSRSSWTVDRTLTFDFSADPKCLPNLGKPTWSGIFGISRDGGALLSAYSNRGPQETGVDVAVYYPGKGCRVLNTETGEVTGDFGPTGKVVGTNLRFALHEAVQAPNPDYATMSSNRCFNADGSESKCTLYLVWETTSLNLRECGTWPFSHPYCDGHGTLGWNSWAKGGRYWLHPYDAPNNPDVNLIPFPIGTDDHGSWPQILGKPDTLPAFAFTTKVKKPAGPNTIPFENEVVGFDPSGSGKIYREGFNWNSGWSSGFACQNAIGRVSWSGDLALLSTDGMGSFGSTSGSAECDLESGDCRCEIIAIPLK